MTATQQDTHSISGLDSANYPPACKPHGSCNLCSILKKEGDLYMTLTTTLAQPSPVELLTEILRGVSLTASCRCLANQNSTRPRKWLERQTACNQAYFDVIQERERIRRGVDEPRNTEAIAAPCEL